MSLSTVKSATKFAFNEIPYGFWLFIIMLVNLRQPIQLEEGVEDGVAACHIDFFA